MTERWKHFLALVTYLVIALSIGWTGNIAYAQSLQITMPVNGTVVSPGQTISVVVNATIACQSMGIVSFDPIPMSAVLTSPPWNFSVTIPTRIAPRDYLMSAFCANTPEVTSGVTIFVENPNPALALKTEDGDLFFNYVGQQMFITAVATFADGQSWPVNWSSRIGYTSNNTAVAIVNSDGKVTAIGPGTTTIRASYGGKTVDVPVSVPQSSPGDLNGDGRIDQDDLNIILSDLNMPATGPNDVRDLNHDGIIDQRDAQAQVGLCTGALCTIPPPPPPPPSDTISPTTTATGSPLANGSGWNNANVTVILAATDNLGGSGVKEISYKLTGAQTGGSVVSGSGTSATISAEGSTVLSYFARDNAGNQEASRTLTIRIDKTKPIISGLPAAGCTLWPPDHRLVQMPTVTASDALSLLVSGAFLVTGTSNEPANGLGDGDTSPDIVINGGTVQLRAERSGLGKGRTYTLMATARDRADNMTTATATCRVPLAR